MNNLIDIRSHYQYKLGTIPGAINIDADSLIRYPNKYLNYEDTYYIFCQYGYSSKKLANILRNLGYSVISIEGGYLSYKQKR